MKLATALRLSRAPDLPTVAIGAVTAAALTAPQLPPVRTALACIGLCAMYAGGGWLDDAFDRDADRITRPDRPIPSGEAPAGVVFDVGFALLLGGALLLISTAIGGLAGWRPVLATVALASLVVFRAAASDHALAPTLYGACRAGVYAVPALLLARQLRPEVIFVGGLAAVYASGAAAAARQRGLEELGAMWPLALLGLPFLIIRPDDTPTLALYTALAAWLVRGLSLVRAGENDRARAHLFAGSALLDGLFLAAFGRLEVAIAAAAACAASFALDRALRRGRPQGA